jgi:hypothetical protein
MITLGFSLRIPVSLPQRKEQDDWQSEGRGFELPQLHFSYDFASSGLATAHVQRDNEWKSPQLMLGASSERIPMQSGPKCLQATFALQPAEE